MEQLKCPSCGGAVLFDSNNAVLFCPYCGGKISQKQDSLDKILKHAENKQQFEEIVRQRMVREDIEAEKRQKKRSASGTILSVLALIVLGLIFFLGIRGENNSEAELQALVTEIQADLESGNYDVALFKTEQLHWPHSDTVGIERWDKQREALKKVITEAKNETDK